MLSPTTAARVAANTHALLHALDGAPNGVPADQRISKSRLLAALNRVQPVKVPVTDNDPAILWPDSRQYDQATMLRLMSEATLPEDALRFAEAAERVKYERLVSDAHQLLKTQAPEYWQPMRELIGGYYCAYHPRFGGGSISDVIGAIWLNPKSSWDSVHCSEVLVHEYTHNALFLEDMTRTIFSETVPRMAEPDGLVVSTILRIPRGYDKAFHSAVVALHLIEFHQKLGTQSRSDLPIDAVRDTAIELERREQFLTANGRRVLQELMAAIESLVASRSSQSR